MGQEPDNLSIFKLVPNEIHFFYTLVGEISDPELLKVYRSVASDREKIKIDRYMFE